MDTELSDRFLNAYCRIEEVLRQVTGASNHESFSSLLDHAAKINASFAQYKDDLKEYAELRNAIVHKRIADRAIAEPHPNVVSRIESIADLITQAPLLEEHFRKHVSICSPLDTVKQVLGLMLKGRFNQMPVYNGKRLVGFLSSDTIAFWLAERFADSDFVDPQIKIKDVLMHAPQQEEYAVLSGKNSIFDALELFDNHYKKGRRLKAIVITEHGNDDSNPIGIITTLEVPKLISLVNPEPLKPSKNKRGSK